MPKRSTVMSRIAAAALAIIAAVCASVAVAQAPAADALKQIIAEGSEAYLNWPTALIDLIHELQQAGDRGLDPEDYPGERLASLLTDLRDTPRSGVEQWALFD